MNLTLNGQNTRIEGVIQDYNGKPLELANIIIIDPDSNFVEGTTSDSQGKFSISNGSQAIGHLKISYIGYEDKILNITKRSNEIINVGVIQMNTSIHIIDEVSVTSERSFIERKLDRIVVNVSKSPLSSSGNTIELLERAPGVFIDGDNQLTLNGRPGVIILLNDKRIRLNNNELNNYLRSLPSSGIDRIEIISNPSAEYDAEGTSGIINIVTQKTDIYGTKGDITLSYGKGLSSSSDAGFTISNNNSYSNILFNINYNFNEAYNHLFTGRKYNTENVETLYDQNAKSVVPTDNYNLSLNSDFYPGKDWILGLNFSGMFSKGRQSGTGRADIYDDSNSLISGYSTDSKSTNRRRNPTANVNIRKTFIENIFNASLDIDYGNYTTEADQNYSTTFFNTLISTDNNQLLLGDIEGDLKYFVVKVDGDYISDQIGKISFGIKSSRVINDNLLLYYDQVNNEIKPNNEYSNWFEYSENINALYLNWRYDRERWKYQAGVRLEHTDIKSNQKTTGDLNTSSSLQAFPSAFVSYVPSNDYTFTLSAGRRINRPNYNQLNPFKQFVNISTFREGNPFLSPEITWNFELGANIYSVLDITTRFSLTNNDILPVLIQNDSLRVTSVKLVNIGEYDYLGLNISYTFDGIKNLSSRISLEYFYNAFIGQVAGYELNNKGTAFRVRSNNSFRIYDTWLVELSGFYQPFYTYGISDFDPRWKIDFGVQKTFWEGAGKFKLAITDIFRQYYPKGSTNFGNINETFISVRDTRRIVLGFTFSFGNNKVKTSTKRSGAEEEQGRI
jgi:iron complex outermembrane receptor protein